LEEISIVSFSKKIQKPLEEISIVHFSNKNHLEEIVIIFQNFLKPLSKHLFSKNLSCENSYSED